jgi:antitoxin CptB
MNARATLDARRTTQSDARRVSLERLRWRCRRGMLENDLVLARFLDARGERITEAETAALLRLLDLPDGELWDLVSGRAEPGDATLRPLVAALRDA